MKPSLEALLTASLSELKTMNRPQVELEGPTETLDLVDAETIQQDVIAHIQDEQNESTESLRDSIQERLAENEMEHTRMRNDIQEVRTLVQNAVSSLEMLHQIVSVESYDSTALVAAQSAMTTLGTTVGDVPPVLEAEDGQLTQASMENLIDFVKKSLNSLKKWIKEKYDAMVLHFRRSARDRVTINKRISKLQELLSSFPDEHGIPNQMVKYAPEFVSLLHFQGKALTPDKTSVSAAVKSVLKLAEEANAKIATDAAKRSLAIADSLATVLVANDHNTAEKALKDIYKQIVHSMPAASMVTVGDEMAGMTFLAPSLNTRYRDADWIMELVNVIHTLQNPIKYRSSGALSSKVATLDELKVSFDLLADLWNDPVMTDNSYFDELAAAWQTANKSYNRMVAMAQSMEFPQMSNELWRGLDIALSAMFQFLDKGYYQIGVLRNPAWRTVHALLYIIEEQVKAYRTVNRV